jgi:hypothetical protein
MKKLLFASAFAAALALGLPMSAQADTKVKVYLGLPHYGYQVGPDYRFRDGYGWYRPVAVYSRGRISCGEARRIVRNSGFRNVDTIECNGRTYTFEATRRGRDVTVFVNSRNGRIWRG